MTKILVIVISLGFTFTPANAAPAQVERVAHTVAYESESVFVSTASVGMLP